MSLFSAKDYAHRKRETPKRTKLATQDKTKKIRRLCFICGDPAIIVCEVEGRKKGLCEIHLKQNNRRDMKFSPVFQKASNL